MYYGRSSTVKKQSQPALLKNFSSLSLADLKKIRSSKQKYDENVEKYKTAYSEVSRHNTRLKEQYERERKLIYQWWETQRTPIEKKLESVKYWLEKQRVGVVGEIGLSSGLFGQEPVVFKGMRLKNNSETQRLLAEFKSTETHLNEAMSRKPHDSFGGRIPDYKQVPNAPVSDQAFTIGGAKVRVDLGSVELQKINALIAAKEAEVSAQKESLNQLKARVAASEKETRQQAKKYQTDFREQKKNVSECPYCGGALNESDSHLDHIYPVSKGGHSVKRNLVFVCSGCNLKKKNQTLRSFLVSAGFVEAVVYERLERLGKDF